MSSFASAHWRAAERREGLAVFPMLPAAVRVMSWIVSSSHPAVPRYSILLSLLMGAMSLQCALDRTAQAVSATESVWSLCLWTMPAVVSNVMAGGVSIGMVVTMVLRGVWKSWVYREPVRRMLLSCTMGGNLRSGLTSSEIAWHVVAGLTKWAAPDILVESTQGSPRFGRDIPEWYGTFFYRTETLPASAGILIR